MLVTILVLSLLPERQQGKKIETANVTPLPMLSSFSAASRITDHPVKIKKVESRGDVVKPDSPLLALTEVLHHWNLSRSNVFERPRAQLAELLVQQPKLINELHDFLLDTTALDQIGGEDDILAVPPAEILQRMAALDMLEELMSLAPDSENGQHAADVLRDIVISTNTAAATIMGRHLWQNDRHDALIALGRADFLKAVDAYLNLEETQKGDLVQHAMFACLRGVGMNDADVAAWQESVSNNYYDSIATDTEYMEQE